MKMRYCYECGRATGGQPLYCQFCGRTYDVKLCPRRHENPRYAEVCSKCGSRELSTPQPKVPVVWKIAQFFVQLLIGFFVVYVVLSFIYDSLSSLETNNAILGLILLLVAFTVVWSMVPDWFKRAIRKSLGKGGHREDR